LLHTINNFTSSQIKYLIIKSLQVICISVILLFVSSIGFVQPGNTQMISPALFNPLYPYIGFGPFLSPIPLPYSGYSFVPYRSASLVLPSLPAITTFPAVTPVGLSVTTLVQSLVPSLVPSPIGLTPIAPPITTTLPQVTLSFSISSLKINLTDLLFTFTFLGIPVPSALPFGI